MGCLGSCPRDRTERDGYRPVEEVTACVLSQYGRMRQDVCVDFLQIQTAAVSLKTCLFALDIFWITGLYLV